jgi:hypothetical protein
LKLAHGVGRPGRIVRPSVASAATSAVSAAQPRHVIHRSGGHGRVARQSRGVVAPSVILLCESPAHSINCPTSNSFESKKFISIFLFCVCGRTRSGAAFLLDGFYTYLNISVYTKDFSMQGKSINDAVYIPQTKIAREYLNLIENIQKFE